MSIKGTLTIDGQDFNIQNLKLSFHQPVDSNGRPNANPGGGNIYLSVESSEAGSLFMSWMLDAEATKDGEIVFLHHQGGKPPRRINFEKGYCVGYDENFDAIGSAPMLVHLVISAKVIKSGADALVKDWEGAAS